MNRRWDLVVLGGGTAGIVGAKVAAGFGARVLLVEADRTGGDCLWTGCVPSKSLLAAAHAVAAAGRSDRFGVVADTPKVDFPAVMRHVRSAIATIEPADSPESLRSAGAEVLFGHGVLTGPTTLRVTSDAAEPDSPVSTVTHDIEFEQLLLATGAAPALPDLPGLSQSRALTSDTVWDLAELPQRLAVLGGGNIGVELAQAFARLGASVSLVEGAQRLLPREETKAALVLTEALRADGVAVHTGAPVTAVRATEDTGAGSLRLDDASTVSYDRLLVAVGRSPRTIGIGLAEAGVEVGADGMVVVDELLRTTNPRIWVAGDPSGHPQFTHLAGSHGSTAATNAVLGTRRKAATVVPRVTYTDPEIAGVGLTCDQAGHGHRSHVVEHTEVDRAVAEQRTEGYSAIVCDKRGTVTGGTVVGPRAGESLGELTLAVSLGLKTRDLAGAVHPYPTWNDGPWKASLADVSEQLDAALPSRAIGVLSAARAAWLRARRSKQT
ncbi:MAG TPA: FAD-dependent oxidoreductase [Ornithinimicrobium sp.]|uniref:dihydrolipoyl dehydrogenase family protein n=1 Tax=Ornithinimicrobium sp. TaxID=1977084 RepID=UPI002B482EFC|nr:FAD-dependent oxidoreductase [Ornithinimicrobium sp.]HKJ11170.1 FAD-dependent oxidoreductase [Ornithinimicrobium sp.]